MLYCFFFFFSSRRRHTRYWRDWSSDVCSSDLVHEWSRPGGALAQSARRWRDWPAGLRHRGGTALLRRHTPLAPTGTYGKKNNQKRESQHEVQRTGTSPDRPAVALPGLQLHSDLRGEW